MDLKILKDTFYLLLSQGAVKLIGFFYTAFFLTNALGVINFGLYSVAISYFVLISSFADFGISRFLIKEVASSNKNMGALLSNVLFLRLISILVIFLLFSVVNIILDKDHLRSMLNIVAVMSILPQSIYITVDNFLIAKQRFSLSALILVAGNLVIASIGFLLVSLGLGTLGAVSAVFLGQIFYSLIMLAFILKEDINILSKVELKLIRKIIKGSLPYGLLGLLGVLYFRIDTILLSYMKSSYDTGIYGASFRFLEATVIIPTAFSTVLFPLLVRMQAKNTSPAPLINKISLVMLPVGLVTTCLFFLIVPYFIKSYLPEFAESINAIKILSFAIPFMFIHIALSQFMLTSEKYLKPLLLISIFPLIINFTLNIIFIPKFGYIGSSWITVISDIFSLLILLFAIRKYIKV